jgi:hypothetical protein
MDFIQKNIILAVKLMKENSRTGRCMVMANILGLAAKFMLENGLMENKKD